MSEQPLEPTVGDACRQVDCIQSMRIMPGQGGSDGACMSRAAGIKQVITIALGSCVRLQSFMLRLRIRRKVNASQMNAINGRALTGTLMMGAHGVLAQQA
jgi:hypothetical protein